jgi:L-lactate utilization protein LutC
MSDYASVKDDATIAKTKEALEANNFKVTVVEDAAAAKDTALALLPKGAEVLTMTSKTLEKTGITKAVDESGEYDAVRPKLNAMYGDESKKGEQRKLGAAPDYSIGSLAAITEGGQLVIASNTGSQLPAHLYGAGHVIFVVGAQKITKDLEDAMQRINEHVVPLEDVRAQEAYGIHTNLSKVAIINKEVNPDRIHIVLAKEALGF